MKTLHGSDTHDVKTHMTSRHTSCQDICLRQTLYGETSHQAHFMKRIVYEGDTHDIKETHIT